MTGPAEPTPADLLAELATLARAVAPAVAPAGHDDLLRSLTATARALFGAAACSLALLEPGSDDPDDDTTPERLHYVAADGEGADAVRGMTIPATQGLAGWVVQSGQPVAVSDLRQDARFARDVAEDTGYVPRAILAVPVTGRTGPIGVLTLLDRDDTREHAAFDLQTASLFADQAALAIEGARASSDLAAVLLTALADAAGDGRPLTEAVRTAFASPPPAADRSAGPVTVAGLLAELAGRSPGDADLAVRVLREVLAPRRGERRA